MRTITDQMGRSIAVPAAPQRIVSLVPSQTELLFDLGVGNRVVGVTKFCIHPKTARKTAAVIGGTKQFDFEKIAALRPDLIIGNKEENFREGIETLARDFPVWMSDIVTLPDALAMIRAVGGLVNAEDVAEALAAEIETSFTSLGERGRSLVSSGASVDARPSALPGASRALYLIWRQPWMGAGAGTFIHEMLTVAGFVNVLANQPRYPELSTDDFRTLQPDVVLLSSEPYPFKAKHLAEVAARCPGARVELVDGELFSWYGSRLRHAAAYLRGMRAAL